MCVPLGLDGLVVMFSLLRVWDVEVLGLNPAMGSAQEASSMGLGVQLWLIQILCSRRPGSSGQSVIMVTPRWKMPTKVTTLYPFFPQQKNKKSVSRVALFACKYYTNNKFSVWLENLTSSIQMLYVSLPKKFIYLFLETKTHIN